MTPRADPYKFRDPELAELARIAAGLDAEMATTPNFFGTPAQKLLILTAGVSPDLTSVAGTASTAVNGVTYTNATGMTGLYPVFTGPCKVNGVRIVPGNTLAQDTGLYMFMGDGTNISIFDFLYLPGTPQGGFNVREYDKKWEDLVIASGFTFYAGLSVWSTAASSTGYIAMPPIVLHGFGATP